MSAVEVIEPGPLTTIQDLGRPGFAHLGIPRSGAADRRSLRRANALVGNPPSAACLETTLVGPRLRILDDCVVALAGAPVRAGLDGRVLPMEGPIRLRAGQELRVGTALIGLRTYVAFAGGIEVDPVLGSRATDLLTGLGPRPLNRRQVLRIGSAIGDPDAAPLPTAIGGEQLLQVMLGPDQERFAQRTLARFRDATFTVTPRSNRIGVRLEGPPITTTTGVDLPSAGLAHGAIQVPPGGNPILMLADHPTTGGYPVIACVRAADLAAIGQLRPGQKLRFAIAGR